MKKIISLLLVLMFSFGMVSTVNQEKVEGASIALGYAVFKAGIAFTGFATYAGWLYANGYTQPIQEMIVGYANKYYDYANGVYTEKVDKVNIIDKMNLYTSALITGNLGNIPTFQELNDIKNDISLDFIPKVNVANLEPAYEFNAYGTSTYRFPKDYSGGSMGTQILVYNQDFYDIREEFAGKIIKILFKTNLPDYFYYADLTNYGWVKSGSYYYPTIRIIAANGNAIKVPLIKAFDLGISAVNTTSQTLTAIGSALVLGTLYRDNYIPIGDTIDYGTTENTFSDGSRDFVFSAPNYYSALNGKATNTQDLENLMNTDEYLQREITRLMEQQQVNEENEVYAPSIGADGMITYPGTETIPENPDIPYSPGATWYENLFNKVGALPDLFIGGITDLWDNTLTPALETIKTGITSIPSELARITDSTQDIPLESINLNNLKLDGIIQKFPFSIPFDYINLVQVLNVEPIEPNLSINLDTKYLKIHHEIDINSINKYIRFFRWFVLLTFTYGLMMITRKVIKW